MTKSPTFDPGFSTAEMTEIWSEGSRVDAILQFEAALALALADAGLADKTEAEAVASACSHPSGDPEGALASTWESGTPLLAILDEVKGRLTTDGERRWLHHGATSQDAFDTAQMLLARESLEALERSLVAIARSMMALARTHQDQPQLGRTFLQHGPATTFGLRVAKWLDATLASIESLRERRADLAVQLGGPVGDRAALGPAGDEVVAALARRLGLVSTALVWHSDRTRMWTLVTTVEQAVRSQAKVALDVALLNQSDTAEVRVRSGSSSSIPGKQNPLDAIHALAAADACRGAAAIITQGRPHELDRALGSWHAEWFALPLVFHTAAATVSSVQRLLGSLEVNAAAMSSQAGVVASEAASAVEEQIAAVAARFDAVVGR